MTTFKKKLTDIQKYYIIHAIGLVLVFIISLTVHDVAKNFPNLFVKVFFPSNLCLWEQMKTLFTPLLIVFALEYFIVGRKLKNFLPCHTFIVVAVPILTIVIYSIYTTIFNSFSFGGAQIILAIILIIIGFVVAFLGTTSTFDFSQYTKATIIILICFFLLLVLCTFVYPRWSLFFDEINQLYGSAYGN